MTMTIIKSQTIHNNSKNYNHNNDNNKTKTITTTKNHQQQIKNCLKQFNDNHDGGDKQQQ